jgi:hypothetical protein
MRGWTRHLEAALTFTLARAVRRREHPPKARELAVKCYLGPSRSKKWVNAGMAFAA